MENATQIELFKGNQPSGQLAVASGEIEFMQMLERLAKDPSVDPAKMHAVLDVQERMINKKAQMAYNAAMMRLLDKIPVIAKQGLIEMKGTSKGGKEYSQKTHFARYEDIDDVIRPLMKNEGFILTHSIQAGDKVTVTTKITHEMGHFETSSMSSPIDTSGSKNNLQGAGSAVSYLKRYNVGCLLNLIYKGVDDDGGRGGMVFISDQCVDNIKKLLEETNTEEKRFLEHLQLTQLENIQAKEYTGVMNMLNAKKAKLAKLKEEGEKQ